MVIVDTSVWIEATRRDGDLAYKVGLENLLEEYEAAWCSPVKLEFMGGARKQDRKQLAFWFECIPYRPIEERHWEAAKRKARKLRDKGHTLPWNDILIATLAIDLNCRVYAKDKHFETMAKEIGLRLYRPGYGGRYEPETVYEMGERIGTVVPRASGDYLCAGDSGIYTFDPATGDKTKLADPEAEKRPDNRFNEGKCDPEGRFWGGTISLLKKTGDASLYMLDEKHDLTVKIPDVTNSNGLCWNAAAHTMYYIDTPTRKIRAYDFDRESGRIVEAGVIVDTEAAGYDSSPDGMTIDAEDKLWVAFCHGGCVVRFDPKTGEKLRQIDIPAVETTACAFGGENLDRLFVTTGIKKDADEPDAGKVFVIDGLGVQGVPAYAYQG